ncbi:MAG: hypothetical protein FJ179_06070 [Gammaproteobacteria bacterium]|nr:hypothetical protein [Gammaproteobacteria bacterium]
MIRLPLEMKSVLLTAMATTIVLPITAAATSAERGLAAATPVVSRRVEPASPSLTEVSVIGAGDGSTLSCAAGAAVRVLAAITARTPRMLFRSRNDPIRILRVRRRTIADQ